MQKVRDELKILSKAGYLTKKQERLVNSKSAEVKELKALRDKFNYCIDAVLKHYNNRRR